MRLIIIAHHLLLYFRVQLEQLCIIMTDKDYFSGYVREVQTVTAFNNKQVILLGLHGSACDEAGYIRCVKAINPSRRPNYRYQRKLNRLIIVSP